MPLNEQSSNPENGDPLTIHLLDEIDLAKRWKISVKTLRNARVTGGLIPFVRIGRCVRYRLSDVLAYEERRVHTSTSDRVPR